MIGRNAGTTRERSVAQTRGPERSRSGMTSITPSLASLRLYGPSMTFMSKTTDQLAKLQREMRARLAHNERYISQSLATRTIMSDLSYGTARAVQWLNGEESAIRAENEWIRALLPAPKAAKVTVQSDQHGKAEVRKNGQVIGRQG